MEHLLKRADFLAAAGGRRVSARGFVMQCRQRSPDLALTPPRVGFTLTRKVGNAVVRNRIRRRLRAAVQQIGANAARCGCDYVLIGRKDALALPYDGLLADIAHAFARIHRETGNDASKTEKRPHRSH